MVSYPNLTVPGQASHRPVVQSTVSLTSSLRVQLVYYLLTIKPNTQIFLLKYLLKKMGGFTHFFI